VNKFAKTPIIADPNGGFQTLESEELTSDLKPLGLSWYSKATCPPRPAHALVVLATPHSPDSATEYHQQEKQGHTARPSTTSSRTRLVRRLSFCQHRPADQLASQVPAFASSCDR
jgi:hypothetical protein